MLRRNQVVTLILVLLAQGSQGQYYFYNDKYYNSHVLTEAGVSLGGFNCLTDLGGRTGAGKGFLKDLNPDKTHPGGGIYLSLLIDQVIGFRTEFSLAKISAADQVLKNDRSVATNRYTRNLHFTSRISELIICAEFYPLLMFGKESYPLFSPYLLAGIGLFKFNPKAYFQGKWVDLQPLRTEGQGFDQYPDREVYSLVQKNFPVGMGVKYEISALLNARIEIIHRILMTDYLDDVSMQYIDPQYFYSNLGGNNSRIAASLSDRSHELQPGFFHREKEIRGNPTNRDAYFSCNIKLGVFLNRKRR